MRQEVYPGIVVDTEIAHGKPTIAGTRVPVVTILGSMARGDSIEEVCDAYGVSREQVQAALGYAGDLVNRTIARSTLDPTTRDEAVEAAFDEEFDPNDPDMLYLRDG